MVSDKEVDVAGLPVASAKRWNLERVDGPVRLNAFEAGIWQDGWQEERSAYTRFDGRPQDRGTSMSPFHRELVRP